MKEIIEVKADGTTEVVQADPSVILAAAPVIVVEESTAVVVAGSDTGLATTKTEPTEVGMAWENASPDNVLSGGIDTLNELKEALLELEGYRGRCKELNEKDSRLEKQIGSKKQAMENEINTTIKKRRQELLGSFSSEIGAAKNRLKKLKAKKDKLKDAKVSERINIETAELREKRKAEKAEIREVYRKERMSRLLNNRLFYALFLPGNKKDVMLLLFIILVILLIPAGIYLGVLPEQKIWMLILLYAADIAIFGGLYAVIASGIRGKHREALRQIREIRSRIRKLEKEEQEMIRDIIKDRDESRYGLEHYDDEIRELQARLDELAAQEKQAAKEFEHSTQITLKNEVTARYADEIAVLTAQHEEVEKAQGAANKRAGEFAVEISKRYESFMGKDMMTLNAVDALISIIREGKASTISGAALLYRQEIQTRTLGKKKG